MSRIDTTFAALKKQGRKALIPYVTAGFPFVDVTPELMHGMVAGGADVIELGVPFSDPSADGQVTETHSISAGLDYPGVGPEHAFLKDIGRAEYVGITDQEALDAFHYLCRTEGIIAALESSHAVAYAMKMAKTMRTDQSILVNLSGRGDKDIGTVADLSNADFYCRPSCKGQSVKGGDQTTGQTIGFTK